MRKGIQFRITSEMVFRAITDFFLVALSFLMAFFIHYVAILSFSETLEHPDTLFYLYSYDFLHALTWLSIISFSVFSLCGFYTKTRTYQSKYKIFVIAQAVSLSYLIFSFVLFVAKIMPGFPRSVLLIGWAVTLSSVVFSRIWSVLWQKLVSNHNNIAHHVDEKLVLVIGGAGYIGSALLPKLLNENYKVRLLDLFVYGDEPVANYLQNKNVEIIRADFRQVDQVVKAVRGVGSVIHLGAIVGDPACSLDENLTIEVNLMATRMIAEVCKGYGVCRFIFASTCSVYGASDEFLDERSKLNPVSLYAKSKIACERVLRSMADNTFSPVILRFSTIFGLSGRTRFDLVVNLLTAKAYFDKKITLYGGDQWRPFLHVDDAAKSIMCALKAPLAMVANEIYNVGNSKLNYTLNDVAERIQHELPGAEILELGTDGDRRNYRVSFDKVEKTMRFKSEWTLEAGITQVVQAMQSGKITDYGDAKFNNAKFLQEMGRDRMASRYHASAEELLVESVENMA